jgi:hypothetical protein
MSDPMNTPLSAAESDALHRLTARLATLDLDPATIEILTAILTADIDLRDSDQDLDAVDTAS